MRGSAVRYPCPSTNNELRAFPAYQAYAVLLVRCMSSIVCCSVACFMRLPHHIAEPPRPIISAEHIELVGLGRV
jgi:hypothetical protein